MEFYSTQLPAQDRYRLLCGFVAPRPIPPVTTLCRDGRSKAAPMSFFNVFSQDPPIVNLGIQARRNGAAKGTTMNIRRTGEFAVNLINLGNADEMITCGPEFPHCSIVQGQVVRMHVRDGCLGKAGCYVRPEYYRPNTRLHADNYIVADRQFVLKPRETVE